MSLCPQPHKAAPRMIPVVLSRALCVCVSAAWSALLQSGTVISALTERPLSLPADVEQPKH